MEMDFSRGFAVALWRCVLQRMAFGGIWGVLLSITVGTRSDFLVSIFFLSERLPSLLGQAMRVWGFFRFFLGLGRFKEE